MLVFAIRNLRQNRRMLSFFLSFLVLYSLIILYLRETCHRDPSSIFWRPEQARLLSYSLFRKAQARNFADQAEKHEPTKWDNTTAPQLCIGIASVNRHGVSYLKETLGSLLKGLDELERRQIYIVVFLAHKNQSKHDASHAVWLRNMVDNLPVYRGNHELLELIEKLESDRSYTAHARKQKIGYSVLLTECAKVNPTYTMTLEDDVIALDGWFHRTLSAIRTAVRKTHEMGRDNFLYLRIFYDGRLLGWNSEEWPYYLGFSSLLVFVEVFFIFALRWRFPLIRQFTSLAFTIILCGVCTPMMIGLFFAAGRSCMLPRRPGVNLMQKYGCCAQGLVFPQQRVVETLLPLYRDTTNAHAAVDTFLEDYANVKNELRWAVTPVLIQHVGGKSSHDTGDQLQGGFAKDMPFDYEFERNDPVQLALEHHAWIDELKSNLRTAELKREANPPVSWACDRCDPKPPVKSRDLQRGCGGSSLFRYSADFYLNYMWLRPTGSALTFSAHIQRAAHGSSLRSAARYVSPDLAPVMLLAADAFAPL
ncbi:hypothetical protein GGR58DRAFT_501401 [Xylaria digitata]|nr:hypothetical protein GGR58DRAFT_501401 [Xylaria digitata]